MSISPAPGIITSAGLSCTDGNDARATQSPSLGRPTSPGLGTEPIQEIGNQKKPAPSLESSQDEVQVQQDSADGKIIIRYLDQSGSLILQIPSSELLRLAHAIDQALEQQARSRALSFCPGIQEGESYGH